MIQIMLRVPNTQLIRCNLLYVSRAVRTWCHNSLLRIGSRGKTQAGGGGVAAGTQEHDHLSDPCDRSNGSGSREENVVGQGDDTDRECKVSDWSVNRHGKYHHFFTRRWRFDSERGKTVWKPCHSARPESYTILGYGSAQDKPQVSAKAAKMSDPVEAFLPIDAGSISPDAQDRPESAGAKQEHDGGVNLSQFIRAGGVDDGDDERKHEDGVGVETAGYLVNDKAVGQPS